MVYCISAVLLNFYVSDTTQGKLIKEIEVDNGYNMIAKAKKTIAAINTHYNPLFKSINLILDIKSMILYKAINWKQIQTIK